MGNKKGFTIVELVTGMIVAAIIAIGAGQILSINGGLIKKAVTRSETNVSYEYAISHMARNINMSAWIMVKDKNTLILHSHSTTVIKQYTFSNKTLEYAENDEKISVLARNIDSDEFFKGLNNIFSENIASRKKEFSAVRVRFYEVLPAGGSVKTSNVFYVARYIKCMENSEIVYLDSRASASKDMGTKKHPYKKMSYNDNAVLAGTRKREKAFVLEGNYNRTSSNYCYALYICEGVQMQYEGNSRGTLFVTKDLHALGSPEKKVQLLFADIACDANSNLSWESFGRLALLENVNIQNYGGIFFRADNIYIKNNNLYKLALTLGYGTAIICENSLNRNVYGNGVGIKTWGGVVDFYNNTIGSAETGLYVNRIGNGANMQDKVNKIYNNTFIGQKVGIDLKVEKRGYTNKDFNIFNNDFQNIPVAVFLSGEKEYNSPGTTRIFNNSIMNTSTPPGYINRCGGITVQASRYCEIYNNTIDLANNCNLGISVGDNPWPTYRTAVLIRNNIIKNSKDCLNIMGASAIIKNNIFFGGANYGIYFSDRATGYLDVNLFNNIFYNIQPLNIEMNNSGRFYINNCTFVNCNIQMVYDKGLNAKNCIFWGGVNIDSKFKKKISYSDIEDYNPALTPNPYPGQGNFYEDPAFVPGDETYVSYCTKTGENGVKVGAYGGEGAAGWADGVGCQGGVGNVQN